MSSARDDLSSPHLGKGIEPVHALTGDSPPVRTEGLSSDEWDRVHLAIQEILSQLADVVSGRRPATLSKAGRTTGTAFHLFSYRVFVPTPMSDADPIVVGVDCLPDTKGVVIRGDIAGEESGQVYFEMAAAKCVPALRDDVVAAAREVAATLADQASLVLQVLDQSSRAGERVR